MSSASSISSRSNVSSIARVWQGAELTAEQRLVHLELNHARLLSSLEEAGVHVAVHQLDPAETIDAKHNLGWRDFGDGQTDGDDLDAVSGREPRRSLARG
jgi:hypothetical protein